MVTMDKLTTQVLETPTETLSLVIALAAILVVAFALYVLHQALSRGRK